MMRFDRWLTHYFTTPEQQIVGSMALFRIMFGLLGLMLMEAIVLSDFEVVRGLVWHPIAATLLFDDVPPQWLLQACYFMLIASYVLLIFGLFTRVATLGALLGALMIAGTRYSFGKVDHADTILLVYIPATMLFYNWGNVYSLDAWRRKRRGITPPDPNTTNWQFGFPRKLILLVLCLLYSLSAWNKIVPPGQWLFDTKRISQFMSTFVDTSTWPQFNIFVANTLPLAFALQVAVILLEGVFLIGLFSIRWRHRVLLLGLCFHTFNLLFTGIGFTQILWTYAFFINWQFLWQRGVAAVGGWSLPKRRWPPLPSSVWSGMVILLALGMAAAYTFQEDWPRLYSFIWLPRHWTHVIAWLFGGYVIWQEANTFWQRPPNVHDRPSATPSLAETS